MQHIPISLVFAYGIDGEKRGLGVSPSRAILNPEGQDFDILPEKQAGFVIHLELLFTL
jgi:hypothetical protein